MSSAKRRRFGLGLNVLTPLTKYNTSVDIDIQWKFRTDDRAVFSSVR